MSFGVTASSYKTTGGLPAAMAAYSFSEGTGSTVADATGNGHDLTLTGATWDPSGHTGAGITNSSTNIGAKVPFVAPYTAMTIMGWVKPLDLTPGTSHAAFGFFDNGESTAFMLWAQRSDFGTPNVLQGNIRINGSLRELHGTALTVGVWAHLALTFDGSHGELYKDGVSVWTYDEAGPIGQNDALCVAGAMANGQYDSDVVVDDVRVYNIALTGAQVLTGMSTPVA